ncbi:hypothetical protein BpHYR1_011518 [Brachionus plicatilis]|uniref:Uncharacterized protein n=1 Tax=Brachionus plicatilis TaxID=10195 RepID=A0A3M7QZ18_BRAPC|nr:hypothetical protein BpHYR1_011518 [Brachionus plicatilis]
MLVKKSILKYLILNTHPCCCCFVVEVCMKIHNRLYSAIKRCRILTGVSLNDLIGANITGKVSV